MSKNKTSRPTRIRHIKIGDYNIAFIHTSYSDGTISQHIEIHHKQSDRVLTLPKTIYDMIQDKAEIIFDIFKTRDDNNIEEIQ